MLSHNTGILICFQGKQRTVFTCSFRKDSLYFPETAFQEKDPTAVRPVPKEGGIFHANKATHWSGGCSGRDGKVTCHQTTKAVSVSDRNGVTVLP